MLNSYLKIAWRNLFKYKGFTAINVLGLSLGLTTCFLIALYVLDAYSYDEFHHNGDYIYRVNADTKFAGEINRNSSSPYPLADILKDYPEVQNSTQIIPGHAFIKKNEEYIRESILFAGPELFEIFTLPMMHGNPATALKEPKTVVITESIARKYFNRTEVLGKTLRVIDSSVHIITGVIKDIPKQSHFTSGFFFSVSDHISSKGDNWLGNVDSRTYILIKKDADPRKIESYFPQILKTNMDPQLKKALNWNLADMERKGNYFRFSLIPLKEIHLESNRSGNLTATEDVLYLRIFALIGLLVLLIAAVNFINLSTACILNRGREVGVRKVLGSSKKGIIIQLLLETVIITIASAIIALFFGWCLLPLFNQLSSKELSVADVSLPQLLPVLIVIIAALSILAGLYPALYFSRLKPVHILKGKLTQTGNLGFRNMLVVFQFTVSIVLIAGTLIVYHQINYIKNRNLGYDRHQIVYFSNVFHLGKQAITFKNEIRKFPEVVNASLTANTATSKNRQENVLFTDATANTKNSYQSQFWEVDHEYLRTFKIKLAKGRDFSEHLSTDSTGIILNESAVRTLKLKDPLNKPVYSYRFVNNRLQYMKHPIVGVVKDFNISSLRNLVTPVALILGKNIDGLSVRIKSADVPNLISKIESTWKGFTSDHKLEYSFMDEDFDAIYRSEQRIGKLFIVFTFITILIACLGLFGLSAHSAEKRTKEIGVRKVLGASITNLVKLLSKDFLKPVLIAICIASPIAYLIMDRWLMDYAYRINIGAWMLLLAGGIAILIAVATVSFQAIKAAVANPVKSLRSE